MRKKAFGLGTTVLGWMVFPKVSFFEFQVLYGGCMQELAW